MANLFNKLRIKFTDLTMLEGVNDKPREDTIMLHKRILNGFMDNQNENDLSVTKDEYQQLQALTYRHLRLHEMLMDHSMHAKLVVMNLPMPRRVS